MRHLSAFQVEAEWTLSSGLSNVPGVTAVQVEGTVRCQVTGSVELLAVLAAAGVHHLVSREPSLEELFLAHYGRAARSRAPPMRREENYDERRASRAVAVRPRSGRSGGALWGLVFGGTIAATSPVRSLFPTAASRARIAPGYTATRGLKPFGPIRRIDAVAGYTAYKTTYTMVILGAIWGLLIATRVCAARKTQDGGSCSSRGPPPADARPRKAAIGLGAGSSRSGCPRRFLPSRGGSPEKVGYRSGASCSATSVVAAAAMFMAVGMLVGQLAATRHDANLIGAGVLSASYLVRMVADSVPGLAWLRWASPFGWIEELRPLTGSRPFAFVPIVALAGAECHRGRGGQGTDLGASALARPDAPGHGWSSSEARPV